MFMVSHALPTQRFTLRLLKQPRTHPPRDMSPRVLFRVRHRPPAHRDIRTSGFYSMRISLLFLTYRYLLSFRIHPCGC